MLDEISRVLVSPAVSAAEAIQRLDEAERTYESVVLQAGRDLSIITACERQLVRWAHRNVHLLPKERYRSALDRLGAGDPARTARRMFELGTLSRITRFVRMVDPIPPPLADGWALMDEFQPMCELRMLDSGIGPLWEAALRAGDRTFVHLGSLAYRGALVIASCEVPPEGKRGRRKIRHFPARILEFEDEEHGLVLRIGPGAAGVMLAASGAVTVECVIFNRPDVLWSAR